MSKPYKAKGKEYLFIIKHNGEIKAHIGTEYGLHTYGDYTILNKYENYDINSIPFPHPKKE